MNFELTMEQKDIQKAAREFAKKEIEPIAEQMDRDEAFPLDIWKKMGDLGFMGISIPEEYGGSGYELLTGVLVAEQIFRVSPALGTSYGTQANLVAHNLNRNGTEDQKKKYLPGICSADLTGSLALTEPNAGSDAVGIQTIAVKNGNHYLINGNKIFITNAPIADIFLTYTKTDPDKKSKGITAFIVERNFPGIDADHKLEKMGVRGSPTGEIFYDNCRVPEENVLGEVNRGIDVMMSGLDSERAFMAAAGLGTAEGAFELALEYSKKREQFGKPISSFQLVQAKLADMYTEIEAARGLVYRAAMVAEEMKRGGKGTEVHKMAAAALLFSTEVSVRVCSHAAQIHGGYSYMMEYPINRFYRDAKIGEIGGGTTEIRRLLIAGEVIKGGTGYLP
ncbi:MAG: acyl-CoA dehydrogenase family protein [Thermodesulfobacteriota bacterium]|nr:acyl-CoA dehydrogenase family protein [Thermodesulfobacteriota bacterium]